MGRGQGDLYFWSGFAELAKRKEQTWLQAEVAGAVSVPFPVSLPDMELGEGTDLKGTAF